MLTSQAQPTVRVLCCRDMDSVRRPLFLHLLFKKLIFLLSQSGTKQPRGALLVSNLPSLQNLLKRDPKAYREDFLLQWNQYLSLQKIVELGLDTTTTQAKARETEARWRELVGFVAQVAHLYPDVTQAFPQHLSTLLLQQQNTALSPETRKTLIQSLVLLRNRDMLPSLECAQFPLSLIPFYNTN